MRSAFKLTNFKKIHNELVNLNELEFNSILQVREICSNISKGFFTNYATANEYCKEKLIKQIDNLFKQFGIVFKLNVGNGCLMKKIFKGKNKFGKIFGEENKFEKDGKIKNILKKTFKNIFLKKKNVDKKGTIKEPLLS